MCNFSLCVYTIKYKYIIPHPQSLIDDTGNRCRYFNRHNNDIIRYKLAKSWRKITGLFKSSRLCKINFYLTDSGLFFLTDFSSCMGCHLSAMRLFGQERVFYHANIYAHTYTHKYTRTHTYTHMLI